MKKFNLNKVTYSVPESWDEVTLENQIKVSNDAELINDEALKKIALISGYANIPMEVLKHTQLTKIPNLFKHLTFLNDPIPIEPIAEFEYKGDKYQVAETLLKNEFQDWISIETAFENNKEKMWNALPYVVAVLAKKEGETLDDFDIEERAKHFRQLPVSIANRLAVFFYQIESTSKINSLLSLNPNPIVLKRVEEVQTILRSQVGGAWHIRLLRSILLKLTKYLKRDWIRYYTSLSFKD